jgi:hypothetical protein
MGRGRSRRSVELVEAARAILEEIQPASVRATCYQLFVRGLIDGMDKLNTNRVGSLLTRAREEGVIPWEWIVQEGRAIEGVPTWDDPADFAQWVQGLYARNKWACQPVRVIVVSEKGTVRGTLAPILDAFAVEFLPVGGYASATRVRELAELRQDKPLRLLYLGDHDPSGRGMSDLDLPRRLVRYASEDPADKDWSAAEVAHYAAAWGLDVRRIALTVADCADLGEDLGFPASDKDDDPRYAWFTDVHGPWCWELDAMNPTVLRERVAGAIQAEIDLGQWERYVAAERLERASIEAAVRTWNGISRLASE